MSETGQAALDLICLGEPLYEFSELPSGAWQPGFGGDVSNVAVAAARQGLRVGVATILGTDGFGDEIAGMYRREGIATNAILRDADRPTGLYFIRHQDNAHRFEYRRAGSAASHMSSDFLPLDAIRNSRVLHVSGITQALGGGCESCVLEAIETARRAGKLVSFDPNFRAALWPVERARKAIHGAMANVDIAMPGLDDARKLTGLSAPEEVARFYLDLGPGIVALTLGDQGALVMTPDIKAFIPPRQTTLVDASGAGDCFDGAFIAEYLKTGDPVASALYAVTAASLSVEGFGAVSPIPSGPTVRRALLDQDFVGGVASGQNPGLRFSS